MYFKLVLDSLKLFEWYDESVKSNDKIGYS